MLQRREQIGDERVTDAGMSIAEENGRMIEERSLFKHPFYQVWQRGELTLDALKNYAGQY